MSSIRRRVLKIEFICVILKSVREKGMLKSEEKLKLAQINPLIELLEKTKSAVAVQEQEYKIQKQAINEKMNKIEEDIKDLKKEKKSLARELKQNQKILSDNKSSLSSIIDNLGKNLCISNDMLLDLIEKKFEEKWKFIYIWTDFHDHVEMMVTAVN